MPHGVRFVDFSVRAWREGPYVQVLAHSTPAGAMRQPVAVKVGQFAADDYRIPIDAPLAYGAAIGRDLARILLPLEVWRLLNESLAIVASRPDLGLRLRLCCDDDLIDLPWEFIYRPDVDGAARSGFLLTDGKISLTREPPSVVGQPPPSDRTQYGLFVGALWDDGQDRWEVKGEYANLAQAMRPIGSLLSFAFSSADDFSAVDDALTRGCDVFHYAGHTDVVDGRGTLVHRIRGQAFQELDEAGLSLSAIGSHVSLEASAKRAPWADSEILAARLASVKTRLAVFNACNSGLWPFVRPLMRAGIPAVVGVQGLISNAAALYFAEKFYQSLAVGLSLDEALTYARLYVMEQSQKTHPCDWGRFMAYTPADSPVLFPRPNAAVTRQRQKAVREGRARTLEGLLAMLQKLDGEHYTRVLSSGSEHRVLVLGRFSATRKPILDLIARELTQTRRYTPFLFDFDGPADRTMLENVTRMAASSRFVIADLTDPKWVMAELLQLVRTFQSLPIVPIIDAARREKEVEAEYERNVSVHKVIVYRDDNHLRSLLPAQIIRAGESMYEALRPRAVID